MAYLCINDNIKIKITVESTVTLSFQSSFLNYNLFFNSILQIILFLSI